MGLHNRPYWQDEQSGGGGGLNLGLPRPSSAVKILLILNVVVFVAQQFAEPQLSLMLGATVGGWWQPWRYVTFQFLHHDFWHIALNMLGLYMLGTPLEEHWGTRKFAWFYLTCGAVAGLAYVVMGALVNLHPLVPIIGASGGVFAIVLACAVLFPHFKLLLLFFPVPIRLAAIIIFAGMIFTVLSGLGSAGPDSRFWSDVAHLGGAVAGAVWVWGLPRVQHARFPLAKRLRKGVWERKMRKMAQEQAEIDRILKKIHDQGLNSLTRGEKHRLAKATKQQQADDRRHSWTH